MTAASASSARGSITALIDGANRGDRDALNRLFAELYAELRGLTEDEIAEALLHDRDVRSQLLHVEP